MLILCWIAEAGTIVANRDNIMNIIPDTTDTKLFIHASEFRKILKQCRQMQTAVQGPETLPSGADSFLLLVFFFPVWD